MTLTLTLPGDRPLTSVRSFVDSLEGSPTAEALTVSERTIQHIMAKLGGASRTEISAWGMYADLSTILSS